MQLGLIELEALKDIAIGAAVKAGEFIFSKFSSRSELKIKRKDTGTSLASKVVTEVDVESQNTILQELQPTIEKYDLALLSEEKVDDKSRLIKDYFWAIDPLDGTLSFIEGNNGFSVSISLIKRDGTPVIGVVYDPVEKSLYHAIKGQGAYKNKVRLSIGNSNENGTFYLVCDKSFRLHKDFARVIQKLSSEITNSGDISFECISHGGAVMNACWAMIKAPACYFKLPKKEQGGGCIWDFGATACIFTEAGGVVCDFYGNPLQLNNCDSVFMHEKGVIFACSEKLKNSIIDLSALPGPHKI